MLTPLPHDRTAPSGNSLMQGTIAGSTKAAQPIPLRLARGKESYQPNRLETARFRWHTREMSTLEKEHQYIATPTKKCGRVVATP